MILEVGCAGHLKVGVRVLLCFTYRFAMPKFGRTFAMGAMIWNFGDPGSWSPWLLESWGKGTVMLYLSLCDA